MKNYTLINRDSEVSMIGTISNPKDINDFKERFMKACGEHFDSDDIHFKQFPDVFNGFYAWDVDVSVGDDGEEYKASVEILQTWMY